MSMKVIHFIHTCGWDKSVMFLEALKHLDYKFSEDMTREDFYALQETFFCGDSTSNIEGINELECYVSTYKYLLSTCDRFEFERLSNCDYTSSWSETNQWLEAKKIVDECGVELR